MACSASETPKLLKRTIKYYETEKPTIIFYKYLLWINQFNMQALKTEWNKEPEIPK